MNRFNTLLQREWMQHQRGWLALMVVPALLVLLAALFGTVIFDTDVDEEMGTSVQYVPDALLIAAGSIGAVGVGTLVINWFTAMFLSPGLARRDQQDRSIEFWLSLPIGHAQSLSTTLLAHLILAPMFALLIGAAGGFLIGVVLVLKNWGLAAWLSLPWGVLLAAVAAVGARLAIGMVLATLWLSPLILLAMAASAWFKRWGVPALIAAIVVAGFLMQKLFASELVWALLQGLTRRASQALLTLDRDGPIQLKFGADSLPVIQSLPDRAVNDLMAALQGLVSPAFGAAMIVAAIGFGLLVLRRTRGA